MNVTEHPLSAEYKYKGRIINLRVDTCALPDGNTAVREVVEHPGGVCIAAITDEDEILLVRQFRYPFLKETLELPAGKLEPGEDPLPAGQRELKEETGCEADRYASLGFLYPSPGYCGEIIHMYRAEGLHFGAAHPDEDEFLDVLRLPFARAVEMVMEGELPDAKTQTAILKIYAQRSMKK